jgi:hypothetical protein
MKVFEYGVLKDGNHPIAYVEGVLVNDSEIGPCLAPGKSRVMGELQDLDRDELKQRDWLYSAFRRVPARTDKGRIIQVYVPKRANVIGEPVVSNQWLYPRTYGHVYQVLTPDAHDSFEGSFREILEWLYRTLAVRPLGLGKKVERRIKVLGSRRNVTTARVEAFFRALYHERILRIRRLWPAKEPRRGFPI